jgi:hypothetical protein
MKSIAMIGQANQLMLIKKVFKIGTLILIFVSLGFSKIEKYSDSRISTVKLSDTSNISILPYDKSMDFIFKSGKSTKLTSKELSQIEILLTNCIDEYNPEQEKRFKEMNSEYPNYKFKKNNFIIDLKRYKRQYIAITNSKDEREVWINCFCSDMSINWRKEIVEVEDGGNCYFNLKINLTTGKYYELRVNGVG